MFQKKYHTNTTQRAVMLINNSAVLIVYNSTLHSWVAAIYCKYYRNILGKTYRKFYSAPFPWGQA